MAWVSFPYTPHPLAATPPFPNGQIAHRPRLIAQIIGPGGKTQKCFVLLDTGADHCVFPLSFAGLIGLDPLTMPMQMTGGCSTSMVPTYHAEIEIRVPYQNAGGPVQEFSFKTMAAFTIGMEAQGLGLLGQTGFFENFKTVFDHKAKTFHIETPDEPPQT